MIDIVCKMYALHLYNNDHMSNDSNRTVNKLKLWSGELPLAGVRLVHETMVDNNYRLTQHVMD